MPLHAKHAATRWSVAGLTTTTVPLTVVLHSRSRFLRARAGAATPASGLGGSRVTIAAAGCQGCVVSHDRHTRLAPVLHKPHCQPAMWRQVVVCSITIATSTSVPHSRPRSHTVTDPGGATWVSGGASSPATCEGARHRPRGSFVASRDGLVSGTSTMCSARKATLRQAVVRMSCVVVSTGCLPSRRSGCMGMDVCATVASGLAGTVATRVAAGSLSDHRNAAIVIGGSFSRRA